MLPVKQSAELIQDASRRLAFKCADHITQDNGGVVTKQEVDMVALTVNLGNFAVALDGQLPEYPEQKVSPLSGECMSTELRTKNDVGCEFTTCG